MLTGGAYIILHRQLNYICSIRNKNLKTDYMFGFVDSIPTKASLLSITIEIELLSITIYQLFLDCHVL